VQWHPQCLLLAQQGRLRLQVIGMAWHGTQLARGWCVAVVSTPHQCVPPRECCRVCLNCGCQRQVDLLLLEDVCG
jgi:hypothetical protein